MNTRISPYRFFLALVCLGLMLTITGLSCSSSSTKTTPENCANRYDDDGDGAVDCVDSDCRDTAICQSNPEFCADGLDNDLDGDVDCADSDCSSGPNCSEDCTNGQDDNGDDRVDCEDPECKGVDPTCGEICGDGVDNDGDSRVDCADSDCTDVVPPCGGGSSADGTICAYGEDEPHVCACADGEDNDGDGHADTDDLHCFGPFDDDEETYATGIPGDNNGSKADKECPFDGNSGTGNDDVCCDLANPEQNITPNGCDERGCCEIDVNGNGTGEHVFIREDCDFAVSCGQAGSHGCPCADVSQCDEGQFCVSDDDSGDGFCSICEACEPNPECQNTCLCGEICYGGFTQPEEECGGGQPGTCVEGVTACPNGDSDCDAAAAERCISGCCYPRCAEGVTACQGTADCPSPTDYYCITGCCVEIPS